MLGDVEHGNIIGEDLERGVLVKQTLQEIVDQLTGMDDIFFYKLAKDEGFREELLQVVLENKNLKIVEYAVQDSIRNIKGRSVILDLKCVNEDGDVINVEIQKEDKDDHQKRVRYNAANIDTSESEKGVRFEELKDIYIIYISRFDMFHKGKTIYHVDRILRETQDVVDNGVHEIYVNTKIDDGTEIAEYMKLLESVVVPDNPRFPKSCNAIKNIKIGMEDDSMCNLVQEYAKEYADEEKIKLMLELYMDGGVSLDMASKKLNMTEEQFLKRVEQCQKQ